MRGICKSFPGVRALHNVSFTLRTGEVHAHGEAAAASEFQGEPSHGASGIQSLTQNRILSLEDVQLSDDGKIVPLAPAPKPKAGETVSDESPRATGRFKGNEHPK